MMFKRLTLVFSGLALMIMSSMLFAESMNEAKVMVAASTWLAQNEVFLEGQTDVAPVKVTRLTVTDGKSLPLWLVDLSPKGYMVMSGDDTLPPVIAFSVSGTYSHNTAKPLPALLERQGEIYQGILKAPQTRGNEEAAANQEYWQGLLEPTRAPSITPSNIIRQPMLSTTWNQGIPYNILCPFDSMSGDYAPVGCVPLSMAQVMKYHEWPPAGKGTVSMDDYYGYVTGRLQADLSFPYDWANMANNYTGEESDLEALPIARLLMECGILLDADYEYEGTSAADADIPDALKNHLRYASAQFNDSRAGFPGEVSQATLFSLIRADMVAGYPAEVGFDVHAFVADGLGTSNGKDYYHFNYGWGGADNGWYLLTDGVDETLIVSATTNIRPAPIPVFKAISCEQSSSFTLAWDFPKRLTAEAFRLTATSGTRTSTVISSNISGTARSYNLTGQSGVKTYTLEAKVNGTWQSASEGVTITVKTNPTPLAQLTVEKELTSVAGATVTTTVTSTVPLNNLQVFSSRPDVLPTSGISVTKVGNGSSFTVKLTPDASAYDNVLLYVTGTDGIGNIVRETILLHVRGDIQTWYTSLSSAVDAALAANKLILMVTGRDSCTNTNYFRNYVCKTEEIKATLDANYVLFYCNYDYSYEYEPFISYLGSDFPLNTIIDPANPTKRLRGHGGPMYVAEARKFLSKENVYLNQNEEDVFVIGETYRLEISHLTPGTTIHYRNDARTPTTSDPVYSDLIPLTSTSTFTARAFKNGNPVGNAVTETYNFMPRVETPQLSTGAFYCFLNTVHVTASCDTPGAVIRYTTDLYYPTASDPIFPAEGLDITEDTILLVRAFKDGMIQSDWNISELYLLTPSDRLAEANAIVTGDGVSMYSFETPWTLQNTTYASAPSAMQSGAIGNNGVSSMVAFVSGEGTLSFSWKVSSERYYDKLKFYLDGELFESIFGEVDWRNFMVDITGGGNHVLIWSYEKDFLAASGSDCGWVDDIVWVASPQVATPAFTVNPLLSGGYFLGSCTVTATCSTPDAVIRYTTNGNTPTSASPVFPATGLSISQATTLKATAFKNGLDASDVAVLSLKPLDALPDVENIVNGNVTLYAFGDIPWFEQSQTYNSAPTAMQSGAITHDQSSSLMAKVSGEGTFSFFWKVSSEEEYDDLSFYIDGTLFGKISGVIDWQKVTFDIVGEGEHLLTWTYAKDFSYSENMDCAWVDDISWMSSDDFYQTVDGIIYYFLGDSWSVVDCEDNFRETAQNLVIPNEIDGFPVVEIGEYAFENCALLESVTLPDSILYIEEEAFYRCTSLRTLTLQEGLLYIGDYAFERCTSLTSVTLPSSLEEICEGAFYRCTSLATLTLREGLLYIGVDAFGWCTSLTSVALPSSLEYIDVWAFEWCTSLTTITVALGSEYYAAMDGVLYTASLDTLVIYPEGKRNETFTLPATVEEYPYALAWNGFLKNIQVENGNTSFESVDGVLYTAGKDTLLVYPSGRKDAIITIPAGVVSLGGSAFGLGESNIIALVDSRDLTDEDCFYILNYLEKLTYVQTDNEVLIEWLNDNRPNVEIIGMDEVLPVQILSDEYFTYAVDDDMATVLTVKDTTIVEAVIPAAIEGIPVVAMNEYLFQNLPNLQRIVIPATLTYGLSEESIDGSLNVESVEVAAGNPSYRSIDGVLYDQDDLLLLYPPAKPSESFTIPNGCVGIGDYAFEDATNLTSVTIPDTVEWIDYNAFEYASNLVEITIGLGVEYIDYDGPFPDSLALVYTDNEYVAEWFEEYMPTVEVRPLSDKPVPSLFSYVIEDDEVIITGISEAGEDSTVLEIPEEIEGMPVTAIAADAFAGNATLEELLIPATVTSIGEGAFADCTSLRFVRLPEGLELLPNGSFAGCTALEYIYISDSVISIGSDETRGYDEGVFEGCENLAIVVIGMGVTSIADNAFAGCDALQVIYTDNESIIPRLRELLGRQVRILPVPTPFRVALQTEYSSITRGLEPNDELIFGLEAEPVTEVAIPEGPAYSLAFTDGTTSLATDVRTFAENATWTITATLASGTSLTIFWDKSASGKDDTYSMPEDFQFTLDIDDAESIDMRETTSYTLENTSNVSKTFTLTVTVTHIEETCQHTYELFPGWNLIGIPFDLDDDSIELLQPFHPMGYDAETQCYIYSDLNYLAGNAVWVFAYETTSLEVSGTPSGLKGVRLHKGWNMVSPLYGEEGAPVPNPGLDQAWYWDATGNKKLLPDENALPGVGYWLYSDKEQVIWNE